MEENAKVVATHLGPEDHGLLTGFLHLEGDGWRQGFGGWGLGAGSRMKVFVTRILEVLEVRSWEELPGKLVRIRRAGLNGPIEAVGHPVKNRWFEARKELETLQ